jgi:iron(III) transport system permease protein
MIKKRQFTKLIIIIATVFFVFGYILRPLYSLLLASLSQKNIIHEIVRRHVLIACFNSLLLSVITVIGSALVGIYFAYSFHYKKIWFRRVFSTLVLLPIAIPPIVGVMSMLFLLGDNGLLMKLLGLSSFNFSGWTAICIVHIYSFYPLFYLFGGIALKNIDDSIIEASYALGANKFKTFYSIILPLLKPAIIGAALLTFMASMASFSAPFIFGNSTRFLTTEIYNAKINGDDSFSALLSILLVAISIAILFLQRWYSVKLPLAGKLKGTGRRNALNDYKKPSSFTFVTSALFCIIIMLPILSLVIISLMPENGMMQQGLNYSLSFDNFRQLFSNSDLLDPFINSIRASVAAVLFTIIAGLMIAQLTRGKPNFMKSILEISGSLPYGIPGTVIAVGLILTFNQPNIFSFNNILVGTFWILPIAYTIRNLPVFVQAVKTGFQAIDISIEEAAASLGATGFKTWRSITLPLIYRSIKEGALLVFINSFGEFVATVLLYNYSTKTIPIEVYAQMRLYSNGMAATYGVVLFIIIIGVVYVSRGMVNNKGLKQLQ